MKRVAPRQETDYWHSSHCRASCSSSSRRHRHCDKDKERSGCRSGSAELYKVPS